MNENPKGNAKEKGLAAKIPGGNTKDFLLNYALYIILGVLIIAVILYEPKFVSVRNFTNILSQASTRAILALGVAGLIVLGGTDLLQVEFLVSPLRFPHLYSRSWIMVQECTQIFPNFRFFYPSSYRCLWVLPLDCLTDLA